MSGPGAASLSVSNDCGGSGLVRAPPNATNVLWSVNPSFYHHFILIISSLITAHLPAPVPDFSSRDIYGTSTVHYRNSRLYSKHSETTRVYSVFSYLLKWFSICWKQNWNSFDESSKRPDWRWRRGPFIIFRHMTTQFHSSNAGIRDRPQIFRRK